MPTQAFTTFFLALVGIIFVDLVLSGDNALVIGAVVKDIPRRWRRLALVLGGAGAIIARIVFTGFATFILSIHYLKIIGGLLVLYVAWQLVIEQDDTSAAELSTATEISPDMLPSLARRSAGAVRTLIGNKVKPDQGRFLIAVVTIVIADITMSLDNVIAIGALANGQLLILSVGLILSIIILLIGSALVAELLERVPSIIILAGLILAFVSGNLILQDIQTVSPFAVSHLLYFAIAVYFVTFSIIFVAIAIRWRRQHRTPRALTNSTRNVEEAKVVKR